MQTCTFHIQGQVQGVGFRPFVYQLARKLGLTGWVLNGQDGVHIEATGTADQLWDFEHLLVAQAPHLARITGVHRSESVYKPAESFDIVQSHSDTPPNLLLSPDFALCPDCSAELANPANRRFGYPFITCTLCGPRYSIVTGLPYDRERTYMDAFPVCPVCAAEYENPLDRRYFSQTNSCPVCGIQLGWYDQQGRGGFSVDSATLIQRAVQALEDGYIIAVKGIGGFLLLADASRRDTLERLRRQKHRPSKPFAVLYPDVAQLSRDILLESWALEALSGAVAPIVLAPLNTQNEHRLALEVIAPGLAHLGVMLPYAPLLECLARAFLKPMVATSGNISHAPIVFENQHALDALPVVADFLLTHNRDIATPQDDSVLRFSPVSGQPILLRRSRGLAPTLVLQAAESWTGTVLAMGSDMKSACTLLNSGNTYVSQYLGELDDFETQRHFRLTLDHLLQVFQANPEAILVDLHSGYFSHQLGQEFARNSGVALHLFQHHTAHFGAILAEHDLFQSAEPVLGVILDGTGLGSDHQIWGGEFFYYHNKQLNRYAHFSYFPHIAGDKMAREPRICALALTAGMGLEVDFVAPWFSPVEWNIYNKLITNKNGLKTSSVGRLFDGVAACCGLVVKSTYEGEAAMYLEEAAWAFFQKEGWTAEVGYICHCVNHNIDVLSLMEQVVSDIHNGVQVQRIAARFHLWLVQAVAQIAEAAQTHQIAFSGGVLQNAVLVELLIQRLGPHFRLYFHRELSPNDENISVGQLALFEEQVVAL